MGGPGDGDVAGQPGPPRGARAPARPTEGGGRGGCRRPVRRGGRFGARTGQAAAVRVVRRRSAAAGRDVGGAGPAAPRRRGHVPAGDGAVGRRGGGGPLEVVRSDRVRRVDLEQLGRAEFERWLGAALGGEVVPATLSSLWSVTLGNALFARRSCWRPRPGGRSTPGRGVATMDGCPWSASWVMSSTEPRGARCRRTAVGRTGGGGRPGGPRRVGRAVRASGGGAGAGRGAARRRRRPGSQAERPPMYGERMCDAMASMTRRRVLADHLVGSTRPRGRRGTPCDGPCGGWRRGLRRPIPAHGRRPFRPVAHDYRNVERLARAALAEEPSPQPG